MLVDHLAHTVLQQNHEGIKGFDLTLQLDAINKVDGNRDTLFAQRIEKWFLQRMAF